MTPHLFLVQRLSALVLAPLVLGHLALMIVAVRNGLSADEILARTRGSIGWAAFYGTFVLAAALHGALGLRTILIEWGRLRTGAASSVAGAASVLLLLLGLRAVWAVTAGGAP